MLLTSNNLISLLHQFLSLLCLVRDCEMIRRILLGDRISPDERKWTIMGQSFGGFCCVTYLSFYPSGLKEVFLAGGLAPLVYNPDPAYRRLFREYL